LNNSTINESNWIKVSNFLKEQIIKGYYSPGEKINERDVAEQVNVSRTPVREAIRHLLNEGFITAMPNKGVFVKKYTPEELDAIQKMLVLLEGLGAEMAVSNITEKDIAQLQKLNADMKSFASKKNYNKYLLLNLDFHLLVAELSGSAELLDTVSQLHKITFRFYYSHVAVHHNWKIFVKDHQAIIDALKGKNKKKFFQLMRKHMERNRKTVKEYYETFNI